MSDGAPDSLIPYDEIVQEALRAVVGRVLGEVERAGGLPGAHHFYITFKTQAAGVDIPSHLIERFPDEMTIVIQNRYWELKVTPSGFEVGLSFNQMPAKLAIPFAAVTGFHDPVGRFRAPVPGAGRRCRADPRGRRQRPAGGDPGRGWIERRLGGFHAQEIADPGRLRWRVLRA